MDFDISMLDIHGKFISSPFFTSISPLREISQETFARIIDIPKGD